MSRDTSPEAARIQVDVLRRMSPERRLQLAFEMSEMVRDLARARIRAHHPDFNDAQVHDELIWELYGVRRGTR